MKRTRKNVVRAIIVAGALAMSLTPAGAADGGDKVIFGTDRTNVTVCYDFSNKDGFDCAWATGRASVSVNLPVRTAR